MKVLLLDQFSVPGGAQLAMLDVLPELRSRGWHVEIGLPGDGAIGNQLRAEGFRVHKIDCGPFASGRKTPQDLARFATQIPRLASQIRALAKDADVVYVNGPRLLPAAAMARFRAPAVFHAHSRLPHGLIQSLAGVSIRRLRANVIANCEYIARRWRAYAPTQVIYNGVRDTACADRRARGEVACIGRVSPEKGQLAFVEVARLVLRFMPDCRFVVHGAPTLGDDAARRYEEQVRARAEGLPVEFAGWVADARSALASADLLLAPSTSVEATTRVILEAFSAGVPVVAFASGGIPEVVEDGKNGLLVRSVEEMASVVVNLMNDPGRRRAMAETARESWRNRFTLDRYQSEIAAVLERARRR